MAAIRVLAAGRAWQQTPANLAQLVQNGKVLCANASLGYALNKVD